MSEAATTITQPPFDSSVLVGRWRDLAPGRTEVRGLQSGLDFREPQYRREVFLRFYEFHLRYRTHPGCVYLLFPELLRDRPREDWLWFALINGLTQNPVTTMVIFQHFPEVPREERRLQELDDWFNQNWARLAFDTDRRYQKKDFPAAVRAYSKALDGETQEAFFVDRHMQNEATPMAAFDWLWKVVDKQFLSFGRLSTWSYLEYLFICGLDLEPSSMMLRDMSGSKSHRNGLALVLGRDDLDWRKDTAFQGKYRPEVLAWMESEADLLISEMKCRHVSQSSGEEWYRHISRFTLESALCTYKGWHRPNRRYPNVYADMLYDRILRGEKDWPAFDFTPFWEARKVLPAHLRLEDNPDDPGLQRVKQNHYRNTGQVIMMDKDWAVFRNDNSWRVGR